MAHDTSSALGRVSVLIPSFNRTTMLQEAVESVLDQTYGDVEVHIGLDGALAPTVQVARSLADGRTVITHSFDQNRGTFAVMEDLIRLSMGSFVVLFSDDDAMEPTFLEECVRSLRADASPRPFAYSHVSFWSEEGLSPSPDCRLVNLNAILFDRSFLERLIATYGYCFPPEYRHYYGDTVFLRRIRSLGPVSHVCRPLVRYRLHPGQQTGFAISFRQILGQAHVMHAIGLPLSAREVVEKLGWLLGSKGNIPSGAIVRHLRRHAGQIRAT